MMRYSQTCCAHCDVILLVRENCSNLIEINSDCLTGKLKLIEL